jgi:ABC-type lipoprotein release transport system permease subunit
MGALMMLRRPIRLLRAALAISLAVTAVAMLTLINWTFRGAVAASLLGQSIVLQVRAADVIAVVILTLLGLTCLSMTMRFAHLEDAADWAVLSAVGWGSNQIIAAVISQGLLVGLFGTLVGTLSAFGLAIWLLAAEIRDIAIPIIGVGLIGIMLVTATAGIPAAILLRSNIATILSRS